MDAQRLLLAPHSGPYGMLGIKFGLATCKASAFSAMLSLLSFWLQNLGFVFGVFGGLGDLMDVRD